MSKSALSNAFRMPTPVKITGRTSSITNSFVNGIIPTVMPSDEEIALALEALGMDALDVRCAYCGDPATEWDHLNAIVLGKRPTGYISEIHNLVPACGKCNQSKGNKPWRSWMFGPSPLSPASRGVGGHRGEGRKDCRLRAEISFCENRLRGGGQRRSLEGVLGCAPGSD